MCADLRIDPDAVEDLARLARRIADDLRGTPGGSAAAELVAFADVARYTAERVREAERVVGDGFREMRR